VERRILAISTVCTHLGCTPNWLQAENKFKCPGHGSGYYMNGVNFEGPTPRPLERFHVFEQESGIWVARTQKAQLELETVRRASSTAAAPPRWSSPCGCTCSASS